MSTTPNTNKLKLINKIHINSKNYDNENLVKIEKEHHGRNKRRLLDQINKSVENLKINKIHLLSPIKVENISHSNISKPIEKIKGKKVEKEKIDIEKIYQKWNEKQMPKNNNKPKENLHLFHNSNIRYNNYAENLKMKYDLLEKFKINQWEKLLKKKMGNEEKDKNEKENKIIIKKIKIEKIKEKNDSKVYSSEEIKNIDKEREIELDIIIFNYNTFFNKRTENLIGKLEYILKVGKNIEKEIKINKKNNLILPGTAIYFNDNIILKFLGYFGSELSLNNIKTYIEINPTNAKLRDITFKIISSGLATQKIYKLTFENNNYKKIFEGNINNWKILLKNIKLKISSTFNITPNDMYFFDEKNGNNYEIKLLIYNQKINNLENILKNFEIKVITTTLLNNIILSPIMFENQFCKKEKEWPKKNLMRGGRKYFPPYGWIGIALKIKNKYDLNDDIWLGKKNTYGEWPVAYHGIGKGKIFEKVLNIINDNLREGHGQLYNSQLNIEKSKDEFPQCGRGVYFSPNIEEAQKYAEKTSLGWYNTKFQFVIMARVNPNKIRSPGGQPIIWILNGNSEEIRPYRLLIKIHCS